MYYNRVELKARARESMRHSAMSPYVTALIYCAVMYIISLLSARLMRVDGLTLTQLMRTSYFLEDPDAVVRWYLSVRPGVLAYVIDLLLNFMTWLLYAGFVVFVLRMIRQQRNSLWNLMDGFQNFLKIIGLNILTGIFVALWSLLFVIPGIIAAYRYRFALYNLYENPGIGVMEALNMSKQQTLGYKGQLFMLDLSYIGWLLLASLTSVVQTGYIYACIFQDPGYYLANPAQVYAITLPMPVGLQVVLGCVWPLLVALFYLPVYQCTELGYFDTAKHTSGVGEGAAPKDPGSFDSGWGGF